MRRRQIGERWVERGQRSLGQVEGRTPLDEGARKLLRDAATHMTLSARAHRVLKVARTIAGLDESESVGEPHIAQALRFRCATPKTR